MKQGIILFCAFVSLILLLTGCLEKDPKGMYLSYVKKAQDTSEVKVVYKIDFPMLGQLASAMDMNLGLFKKGKNQKVVAEINAMGQSATAYVYNLDGKIVSCQKSKGTFGGTAETTCKRSTDKDMQAFTGLYNLTQATSIVQSEALSITYDGAETVVGRACDRFTIDITDLKKLFELTGTDTSEFDSTTDLGGKARITYCLDKKTGIGLNFSIYSVKESELSEEGGFDKLMGFTATSFSERVDDSAFNLPVKYFILDSGCDKDELLILIDPYEQYKGPVDVKILKSIYGTEKEVIRTISLGETDIKTTAIKKLLVKHGQTNPYSVYYEVCLGSECKSSSCYVDKSISCLKNSGDELLCNADKECLYSDPLCEVFSCYNVKNEAECNATTKCEWYSYSSVNYGTTGYCYEKSCYDFTTQSECVSSGLSCEWSGNELSGKHCSTFSCYSKDTEKECLASGKCDWLNGYCSTKISISGID